MSTTAIAEIEVESRTREDELELIRKNHGGVLRPEDMVEFAKDPETTLHHDFNWDIEEAAYQHWLETARRIIRAVVTIVGEGDTAISYRAYVSLSSDRGKDGYRAIAEVFTDEERTEIMLQDALQELSSFKKKYYVLKQLKKIFEDIDEVLKKKE